MTLSRSEATILEGTTATYVVLIEKATILGIEVAHKPLLLSEINTITLSYTNDADGSTINGRSNQDVKNTNDVEIHARGELFWHIQTADAVIVDSSLSSADLEPHTAVFHIVTTSGNVAYATLHLWIQKR